MTVCALCGASLEGHRVDARYCGGPCRALASDFGRILDGDPNAPYSSVAERLARANPRTRKLLMGGGDGGEDE